MAGNGRQSVDHRHPRDARWNTADRHWRDAARLLVSRSRGARLDARAPDTGITKLEFDTRRPRRTQSRRPRDGSAGRATRGHARRAVRLSAPSGTRRQNPHVTPVRDDLVGPLRPALLATLGAMALILLIGCANVAALVLGQVDARSTEFAVRSALGAKRQRLAQQLIVEVLLVAAGAGALGATLAWVGFPVVIDALPLGAWAESAAPDWRVFTSAMAIAIAAALLVMLIPIISLCRGDLRGVLSRIRTGGIRRAWRTPGERSRDRPGRARCDDRRKCGAARAQRRQPVRRRARRADGRRGRGGRGASRWRESRPPRADVDRPPGRVARTPGCAFGGRGAAAAAARRRLQGRAWHRRPSRSQEPGDGIPNRDAWLSRKHRDRRSPAAARSAAPTAEMPNEWSSSTKRSHRSTLPASIPSAN